MAMTHRPSVVTGLKTAVRFYALILVVWFVGLVVMAPALMVFEAEVDPVVANLPEGFEAPEGDVAIMVLRAVEGVAGPLSLAVTIGILLTWIWTVLWHAGMARFMVWDGGAPVSVARILGLGLGAWWRYFRLSVTSLIVLMTALAAIWLPVMALVRSTPSSGSEERMVLVIAAGIIVSGLAKLVTWAATLRGCWELAKPTSRSAIAAYVRGLTGVFQQSISTFGVMLFFAVPEILLLAAPMVMPIFWPQLRTGFVGDVLGLGASLPAVFFSVALFAAFSPVSGMVGESEDG